MAIGERIHFFRNLRGMTQKYLGQLLGFSERTADVRVAQYESEARTPKKDTIDAIAHYLEVSPSALNVPDIDSYDGVMHTLFVLEDQYGLIIDELAGEVCIRFDKYDCKIMDQIFSWKREADKLRNGEISKEDYDQWRYTYPEMETRRHRESQDQ